MRHRFLLPILAVCTATAPFQAFAQDSAATHEWRQSIHAYLLGPTIEGTAGIGPADTDVKVDAGEVFDMLEGAFLGMYLAEKNGWGVFADLVYMDLESDFSLARGAVKGDLGNKQFTAAVSATRRLNPNWQLLAGGMYTDVKLSLDTAGFAGGQSRRRSESWVDPFVGARFESPMGERWSFAGFGYLGGFGVGSDLMWSLNAGVAYHVSEHNAFTLMYRYIDFDYEDGNGLDRFRFDIAEHGPALGWRFSF
ncbi:outer membrane protein [Parahaliea aestuarii]|uniref:Porin family protein n=1 Tax=Parahaliea aestuarii TaxID=1852021 RepID=A0A5C9A0I1_9GAMM|nr:outer membrane beta-barrel protein [Parahaliea aestuarii]TXS93569.1 porin family protein [Parahaliea aestuarii]